MQWYRLLKDVIEQSPHAAAIIGPNRSSNIVPVRELTFQALKPNPPHKWKLLVFGQNPYPRVESATGIAMLDNTFHSWNDERFGKVVSMRCIIKAAAIWAKCADRNTPVGDLRSILHKRKTLQPIEWFSSVLEQGALLLNASLTADAGDRVTPASGPKHNHAALWGPVVRVIITEILAAKQREADQGNTADAGIVFAWWGQSARNLRALVEELQPNYPSVKIQHVDWCNPAAQGDIFCAGNHFQDVNDAIARVGMQPIYWLPSADSNLAISSNSKMKSFVSNTVSLHKTYLERIQSVKDETSGAKTLPITDLAQLPLLPFSEATEQLNDVIPEFPTHARRCIEYANSNLTAQLKTDQVAALHLYTLDCEFYRQLNVMLRDPSHLNLHAYRLWLRVFLSALDQLERADAGMLLWRGVNLDLSASYPRGSTITWWGVSSCTSEVSVAHGFMGNSGARTLFRIQAHKAFSLMKYSAFKGQAEFILAPGTQLIVRNVRRATDGLVEIELEQSREPELVR